VIFKRVQDGAILLDTRSEVYFGLNLVGSRIWEMLPGCVTLEALCVALGQEYPEVDEGMLRLDIVELLEELAGYGLVHAGE